MQDGVFKNGGKFEKPEVLKRSITDVT